MNSGPYLLDNLSIFYLHRRLYESNDFDCDDTDFHLENDRKYVFDVEILKISSGELGPAKLSEYATAGEPLSNTLALAKMISKNNNITFKTLLLE